VRVRVDARAGESIGEWHGDGVQLQTSSDRPRLRPHRTLHAPTSDEAHHSSLRRFARSTNENTCVRYIRQQMCWSPVGVWSGRAEPEARGNAARGRRGLKRHHLWSVGIAKCTTVDTAHRPAPPAGKVTRNHGAVVPPPRQVSTHARMRSQHTYQISSLSTTLHTHDSRHATWRIQRQLTAST